MTPDMGSITTWGSLVRCCRLSATPWLAHARHVVVVFDATSPVKAWLKFRGRHARHKLSY